jgi:AcrR family transcriptional regulator
VKKKQPAIALPQQTDERVERSRRVVLATTYALLTKSGLAGVSVDEVARQSGVAKTTIYRHWPSRSRLLLDACSQIGTKPEAPDTGTLKNDLETLTSGIASRLSLPWATVLPSLIDAAERDKEIAGLQSQIHGQMRNAFVLVIDRARRRGEIPRTQETSEMIASILGPLFYRRWFSREVINEHFVKDIVSRAISKKR